MSEMYLDHNATTPVVPEAARAVADAMGQTGNPSSVHGFGRAARRALQRARRQVADLVGAPADAVVFTSGGTEANLLALRGLGCARFVVSAIEHDSVLRAAPDAARVPVGADGVIDLSALRELLADAGADTLVSVMLANNETGVVQPVAEVARIAHACGALVHCDAVQAAGKLAVDMEALGADALTLSAHKLGGPPGVGALVLRDGVRLAAQLVGGGQERRRRAGTENLPGIVGFGVAAALAARRQADYAARIGALRDALEAAVRDACPAARVYGAGAERLANTSCIGLPGVPAETQVMALDLDGVAVSAGSACSSGKVTASHVLRAMGLDEAAAGSAIRVSLGWGSTAADVERFLAAWRRLGDRAAA